MPLNVYQNIQASGSVPVGWTANPGGTIKYRVHPEILRYLRTLLPGLWQKVIKKGNPGEVHYFEHSSGQVAGVKYFP